MLNSAPSPDPAWGPHNVWDGLKYLGNISVIGGFTFIFLFLLVKLQDDHHLPHPVHLVRKLLAVWHTTDDQIAKLCGADASDYLALLRSVVYSLSILAIPGLLLILPINVFFGNRPINDQLEAATVSHLPTGSPWFWLHALFSISGCCLIHYSLQRLEAHLHSTRYQRTEPLDSVAAFSIMIRGVPRGLARHKEPLTEYFEHLYPGKVFHVCVPKDLVTFRMTSTNLKSLHSQLLNAKALAEVENGRLRAEEEEEGSLWMHEDELSSHYRPLSGAVGEDVGLVESDDEEENSVNLREWRFNQRASRNNRISACWRALLRHFWQCIGNRRKGRWRRLFWVLGGWQWSDEVRRIEAQIASHENTLEGYRSGSARGAGIAFVTFRDVFTATRALRDASWKAHARSQPHLAMHRWRAERAPPPGKVVWENMGSSAVGRKVRSFLVNCGVLSVLLFWSSPLAMVTAVNSASERLDPDAVQHFQSWIAWAKGYNWLAALLCQFLPNILTFFAMYFYIPKALSRLAKFECHVTVSGEQQATLVKMVCFFLVNLFLLKATVETTLESAIMHFGQCYTSPQGCKDMEYLFSDSFVGRSSVSALAFLITSALFGVSLDLLSPVWMIKRHFNLLKQNYLGLRTLLGYSVHPSNSERIFLSDERENEHILDFEENGGTDLTGQLNEGFHPSFPDQNMIDYPPNETLRIPTEVTKIPKFDFPQHYAYNLTAYAMALLYSSVAPLVLPAGIVFFFYRFCVDKYNFLFIYRNSASPPATDGRLMAIVLKVKRVLICCHLGGMVIFYFLRGDQMRLQMLVTFMAFILFSFQYSIEKFMGLPQESGLDGYFIQGLGAIEQFIHGGQTGYEVMSRAAMQESASVGILNIS